MKAHPVILPDDFAKAEAARRVNDYMNHYVQALDTKAGLFLAGNVTAASLLLKDWPCDAFGHGIAMASITLFASSTLLSGAVIFPRRPSGSSGSVIFWGNVCQDVDAHHYARRFDTCVNDGKLDDHYSQQNYCTAQLLSRKFVWLRLGIFLFFIALIAGFIAFLRSPVGL